MLYLQCHVKAVSSNLVVLQFNVVLQNDYKMFGAVKSVKTSGDVDRPGLPGIPELQVQDSEISSVGHQGGLTGSLWHSPVS